MFFRKGVLKKNSQILQENTVLESLFNKVAGLKAKNRFFPVKFAKLIRTPIFPEHLQWLLLFRALSENYDGSF